MTQRSKEQAVEYVKEQGADKCNPGARSTKNGKKEHGAVEILKKEHGARGKIKKEQGAQKNEKGAGKRRKRSKRQKIERSREQEGKLLKEQGAWTPPNRGSFILCLRSLLLDSTF